MVVQWSDPDSKAKWWRCCGVGTWVEAGLYDESGLEMEVGGDMGDAVLQLCVCFCVCVWLRGGRKGSEVLEQKISLLSLLLLFLFLSPGQTYSNSNLCDFTAHWIPKKLTTLYWEARRNGGVGWCYELNKGNLKDRGKWKYVGWGKLHYYCVLSTFFCFRSKVVTWNCTDTDHRNKHFNWNININELCNCNNIFKY